LFSSVGLTTQVNAAPPILASYPYSTDLLPTNVDPSISVATTVTTTRIPYVGNDGFGNVYEMYPESLTVSAATVNPAKYVEYSLTKSSGNFEQIAVKFAVGKGGSNDPRGLLVKSSLDNFSTSVFLETLPTGANAAPVAKSFTVDASTTNSVSFRFFVWAPGNSNSIDMRNLSFESAALPAPSAPLAPTVVAGSSSVVVTVAAGTGGMPASYLVTSTPGSFTCTVTGASGNCTVSGLTNGTSYTFQATATNGGGTSALSAASTAVTPQPAVPGVPPAPTVVAGSSSVVVTVAAGTGGMPASYLVTSTPGSFTCTVAGASGNCTVSGLTNGTSYTFQATATNGGGTSALSAASTAVTPVAPTTTTSSTTTIPSTTTTTTTTAAPALSIVIQAPVTTVATGQKSVATIAPATTVAPVTSVLKTMVSTTTTTTTLPAIVTTTTVGPPVVGKVDAGQTAVQVDGVKTDATVTRENNQMVVTSGALSATLSGIDKAGKTAPLDSDGTVHLSGGDIIKIKVGGFKPDSLVEVWLFSTPTKLGSAVISADGTMTGAFRLPVGIKSGSHRVVISAKLPNGKPTTFTLGILVGNISTTSTLTRVLIAIPISLAIGFGFVLPTQLRRRRSKKYSHA